LSPFSAFDAPIEVSGILEKQLLEVSEIEMNLINRQIKILEQSMIHKSDLTSSPPVFTPLSNDRDKRALDSLMEKRMQIEQQVKELQKLNQQQSALKAEEHKMQPKYIDVCMILYKRLKERYQNANRAIKEYTKKKEEFLKKQGTKQ
ncbi:hypothetical protein ACFL5V_10600, partial [Fibrobacterota bacterium]